MKKGSRHKSTSEQQTPEQSDPCVKQEPPRYVDVQQPVPKCQTELHNDFYPLRQIIEMVYYYMLERCSPDKWRRLDIARMFGGEEELEQEIKKEIDDLELRSLAAIHGKLLLAGPREDGFPLLTSNYVKTWLIPRVPRDTYPDAHDCLQRWLDDLPAPPAVAEQETPGAVTATTTESKPSVVAPDHVAPVEKENDAKQEAAEDEYVQRKDVERMLVANGFSLGNAHTRVFRNAKIALGESDKGILRSIAEEWASRQKFGRPRGRSVINLEPFDREAIEASTETAVDG